jgi:ribosomal protein S18 acetylase RimI-like enzyme
MADDISIAPLDPSQIDLVGPLWKALLDHVAALPQAAVPIRPFEQSWPLERRQMLEALDKDAFVFVARRGQEPVGYVYVVIEDADPVWYTGGRYADLAHLSVAPDERGAGIGSALLDAMDAELERRGINDVQIGVDRGNEAAALLYTRRGYRPDFQLFYGSPGGKPWACLARDAADRKAGRGRCAPPGPAAPQAGPGPAGTGPATSAPSPSSEAPA